MSSAEYLGALAAAFWIAGAFRNGARDSKGRIQTGGDLSLIALVLVLATIVAWVVETVR